jgi:[CysO sulfur-carrier protein]-S-L-cysteine hydrolase
MSAKREQKTDKGSMQGRQDSAPQLRSGRGRPRSQQEIDAKPKLANTENLFVKMITLRTSHRDQIFANARAADPEECCGLIGGSEHSHASSIYTLRNVAADKIVSYEAAPEDLFAAQRQMRDRGEQLIAIYHSHPRSAEPVPSETDVRLAFYPRAIYFIIGLGGAQPVMRAFRISEREERWEQVEYAIAGE